MIPPGPPHLAGRRLSRAQRPSFDSLLLSGRRAGRGGRALRRMWEGKAERRVFRKTACGLHPQCERVLPDPLTQADCFPPARKTVIKEGIKKIWVYTRQYSYNMIFLVFMSSCIPRPGTTTARLSRHTVQGSELARRAWRLTAEVNSGCLCPAARLTFPASKCHKRPSLRTHCTGRRACTPGMAFNAGSESRLLMPGRPKAGRGGARALIHGFPSQTKAE